MLAEVVVDLEAALLHLGIEDLLGHRRAAAATGSRFCFGF
jgi:hypothetical protein